MKLSNIVGVLKTKDERFANREITINRCTARINKQLTALYLHRLIEWIRYGSSSPRSYLWAFHTNVCLRLMAHQSRRDDSNL